MSHQPPFDERPRSPETVHDESYRPAPPHGDVSPDGRRAYPRPSPLAKWIVWGGTGLAAAALTAGAVIAARHVADMVSPHPRPQRRAPYRPEEAAQPRMSLKAPEPRPQRSLIEEIEANSATLSNSLDNVVRSVSSAVTGFHGVASQTNSILREFGDTAALIRDLIDRRPPTEPSGFQDDEQAPKAEPADHDPRMHRL